MSFNANSTAEIVIAGSDPIVTLSDPFGTPLQDRVTAALGNGLGYSVTAINIANTFTAGGVMTDSYPYTATIDVLAAIDFSSAQDIANSLANAFYVASGTYPTSVAVTKINNASTGVTPQGTPTSPLLDPFAGILNFLKNLGPIAQAILAIGVGLVIYVVVKNPPKLKLGR